jgi:hypothetical protein
MVFDVIRLRKRFIVNEDCRTITAAICESDVSLFRTVCLQAPSGKISLDSIEVML